VEVVGVASKLTKKTTGSRLEAREVEVVGDASKRRKEPPPARVWTRGRWWWWVTCRNAEKHHLRLVFGCEAGGGDDGLLVLNSSFSLTLPHHAASKLVNRCRHILVGLDNGCRFLDDDYVVSSMRGSDSSHITKTDLHHQRIVHGMPPNQVTQATLRFPPLSQLRRAIPCYVFLSFLTMEQFTLCLVTTTYATYATYAQYATPYAPYAPFMLFQGYDDFFLIPIMPFYVCSNHGHSSYIFVCIGLFLFFTDFLSFYKNVAYEIDSKFCWLMFFEALKLRIELETISNKFILDLVKNSS
jgi:hypothetical protein